MVLALDRGCNPLHGVTDADKSSYANLLQAAAVAVAGINTAAAIQMADQQYQIAKLYLDIAKSWRNYYNNSYVPVENQELAEAFGLQKETPLERVAIGRARTVARAQLEGQLDHIMEGVSQYCTGFRAAMIKDQVTIQAQTLASLAGAGQRNEDAYVDAKNALRFKRITETLNRGRGIIANNAAFANMAAGIYGDLGKQAREGAAGAVYYLGWSAARRPTEYAQTTYYQRPYRPTAWYNEEADLVAQYAGT